MCVVLLTGFRNTDTHM